MAKSEIIVWNGYKYRRYPDSARASDRSYFRRSGKGFTALLHRDVWELGNGAIPAGHHIHHIDGDPGNNDLSNLECIEANEHLCEHGAKWTPQRRKQQAEHLDRIRDTAKAWHSSDEGRAKHREIGAMAYKNFAGAPKPCGHCGVTFTPRKLGSVDLYCSNKCKSAARRASGIDDEHRACGECAAGFTANRYSKSLACSRSCASRARGRTMRARVRPDS